MRAIAHPFPTYRDFAIDAHSDAGVELAHHSFDLWVHALAMVFGGLLAGYCGFRILDIDVLASAQPASAATQSGLTPLLALTIFVAIAAWCLLEAYRCSRKAAMTGSRVRNDDPLGVAALPNLPLRA